MVTDGKKYVIDCFNIEGIFHIIQSISSPKAESGISQDRLSKLADLSFNFVITVESRANENPTIDTLTKIANGVGVDDLIK